MTKIHDFFFGDIDDNSEAAVQLLESDAISSAASASGGVRQAFDRISREKRRDITRRKFALAGVFGGVVLALLAGLSGVAWVQALATAVVALLAGLTAILPK